MRIDYLQQFGVLSPAFIPPAVEIPEKWTAKLMPFNFFGIPVWGNAQQSKTAIKDFLITSLSMFAEASAIGQAGLNPLTGVPSVCFYHNRGKKQMQFMQEAMIATPAYGTAERPYYLKTPYLIEAGDQITVEVSYTSTFPEWPGPSNVFPSYLYCFLNLAGGEPR